MSENLAALGCVGSDVTAGAVPPPRISSGCTQPRVMLSDGSWLSTDCADRLDLPPQRCDKTVQHLVKSHHLHLHLSVVGGPCTYGDDANTQTKHTQTTQ